MQNFNGGSEVVVHNSFEENVVFSGGGGQVGLATLAQVWMDNAPRNPVSKTWFYAPGNWAEGLSFGTEDYADGMRQRWTRTAWTQDDPTLAYSLNPRVTESKVGDGEQIPSEQQLAWQQWSNGKDSYGCFCQKIVWQIKV